jgi:hypothetical protein
MQKMMHVCVAFAKVSSEMQCVSKPKPPKILQSQRTGQVSWVWVWRLGMRMTTANARVQRLAMFRGGGAAVASDNAASGALGRRWRQGVCRGIKSGSNLVLAALQLCPKLLSAAALCKNK